MPIVQECDLELMGSSWNHAVLGLDLDAKVWLALRQWDARQKIG